ncbi:MAG: redoxin domain-containing protein [Leptothrix sp. (in: b-proteobacteria)]
MAALDPQCSADLADFQLIRRRLAATVALLPWLTGLPAAHAAPAALGEVVRWPTVSLLDGRRLSAAALRDVVTVVVFFSTTCTYCGRHNQHVEKLVRASAGQPLQVIGAALDRDEALVRDYLRQHAYSFPVTLDHQPLRDALSARRMIPLTCVIDRAGQLREVIPGEMFEADVLELVRWARA